MLQCIQYVDADTLQQLVPRLVDLLKSAVGLSTKTGCADVIVQLSTHCARDLQPHAGKLLLALLNGLSDRNATVKKRYATTIGHLVKVHFSTNICQFASSYTVMNFYLQVIFMCEYMHSCLLIHCLCKFYQNDRDQFLTTGNCGVRMCEL